MSRLADRLGSRPGNDVVPATLPSLVITHEVGLAKGGQEALVGDRLDHSLHVENTGDARAENKVAELPVPDVAGRGGRRDPPTG